MQKKTEKLKTYYLEMRDYGDFSLKESSVNLEVEFIDPPDPKLNRRFYIEVGSLWKWTDRLAWTEDDWKEYVTKRLIQTYLGKLNDKEIGYFELESQNGGNVEIVLFGLLPSFIGKGLGGIFLSKCIECAWSIPGTERVWLHTCTYDHKHALDNYLKRGFKIYKTEEN